MRTAAISWRCSSLIALLSSQLRVCCSIRRDLLSSSTILPACGIQKHRTRRTSSFCAGASLSIISIVCFSRSFKFCKDDVRSFPCRPAPSSVRCSSKTAMNWPGKSGISKNWGTNVLSAVIQSMLSQLMTEGTREI